MVSSFHSWPCITTDLCLESWGQPAGRASSSECPCEGPGGSVGGQDTEWGPTHILPGAYPLASTEEPCAWQDWAIGARGTRWRPSLWIGSFGSRGSDKSLPSSFSAASLWIGHHVPTTGFPARPWPLLHWIPVRASPRPAMPAGHAAQPHTANLSSRKAKGQGPACCSPSPAPEGAVPRRGTWEMGPMAQGDGLAGLSETVCDGYCFLLPSKPLQPSAPHVTEPPNPTPAPCTPTFPEPPNPTPVPGTLHIP